MSGSRVLCIIPAHPNEPYHATVESVKKQSLPVTHIEVLTEVVTEKLPFPAKMSIVINNFLSKIDLSKYDVLLRVDVDTVLPANFLEENLKKGYSALGYGYAQIIDVPTFLKVMGGRMHPNHDDSYVLAKFHYCGYRVSAENYAVKPLLKRKPGRHHGSKWFVEQGELDYMYGDDPLNMVLNLGYNYTEYKGYAAFYIFGFFKGLMLQRERFDIAPLVIHRNMLKFRDPRRFFRLFIYLKRKIGD